MYEEYMKKCFELAKQGLGKTSPNPMVGCVVLDKNGKEISTGYHAKYGENHAERDALLKLKNGEEEDGTIIVSLEPCSHYGKTLPCVDLIIERKIKKVVFAMKDPNPIVSSVQKLEENGIEVLSGVLEEEAKALNEVFVTNMTLKRPFVALKTATTLDGKISTRTGDSKWITSSLSRDKGHGLREIYDAILTTSNTVLADNPNFNNKQKIIIDRTLKVPTNMNFFKTGKIFIVHDETLTPSENLPNLEYIPCPTINGQIDITSLLKILFEKKIMSIFVEAGGNFNGSIIDLGIVDKIYQFIAPKILADNTGQSAFAGRNVQLIKDCVEFKMQSVEKIGNDVLITLKRHCEL